jgi:hypothetical protein
MFLNSAFNAVWVAFALSLFMHLGSKFQIAFYAPVTRAVGRTDHAGRTAPGLRAARCKQNRAVSLL